MEKLGSLASDSLREMTKLNIPEMRNTFPDLVKTLALLDARQGAACLLFQAEYWGPASLLRQRRFPRAIEIIARLSCRKQVHMIRLI